MKDKESYFELLKKPAARPLPLGFFHIRQASSGERRGRIFFERSDFHQTDRYQAGLCPKPIACLLLSKPEGHEN